MCIDENNRSYTAVAKWFIFRLNEMTLSVIEGTKIKTNMAVGQRYTFNSAGEILSPVKPHM